MMLELSDLLVRICPEQRATVETIPEVFGLIACEWIPFIYLIEYSERVDVFHGVTPIADDLPST
jgi:hypothetical protein